jgi:hypothetical protein
MAVWSVEDRRRTVQRALALAHRGRALVHPQVERACRWECASKLGLKAVHSLRVFLSRTLERGGRSLGRAALDVDNEPRPAIHLSWRCRVWIANGPPPCASVASQKKKKKISAEKAPY